MAPKRTSEAIYSKLLDAWQAPDGAGRALGCIATSYTFNPPFFEEDCLSRFLRLDTNPQTDGVAYLIEREEKLAEARVVALVDHRHADPLRSLRWDLLPVRVPGAAQHAKVSVLVWERNIRLIVASANLTEPGYCRNREVFGVLDFYDGTSAPLDGLRSVLRFLESVVQDYVPGEEAGSGPKPRALQLVARIRAMAGKLNPGRRDAASVNPVFSGDLGGKRFSPVQWLKSQIPRNQRPHRAFVVSPFFDDEDEAAFEGLKSCLLLRGDRRVSLATEGAPIEDGRVRLHFPPWLASVATGRLEVGLHRVLPEESEDEHELRPLHAKMICLERSGSYRISLIGSSNFTRAGLGLGHKPVNLEANLAYGSRNESSLKKLKRIEPRVSDACDLDRVVFKPDRDPDEEAGELKPALPFAFQEALFLPKPDGCELILRVAGEPPSGWLLRDPSGKELDTDKGWRARGAPGEFRMKWEPLRAPSYLEVVWDLEGKDQVAQWAVNVTEPALLQPPDELRNLPLSTLLEILTSARPIHETLRRILRRQARSNRAALDVQLDPLRRFQDQTALLYRTRGVARALEQLKQRLERPVLHEEALQWRLEGPVGPLKLAEALVREARSPAEGAFLVAEVALTVSGVRPEKTSASLASRKVQRHLRRCVKRLRDMVDLRTLGRAYPRLRGYVTEALDKARA